MHELRGTFVAGRAGALQARRAAARVALGGQLRQRALDRPVQHQADRAGRGAVRAEQDHAARKVAGRHGVRDQHHARARHIRHLRAAAGARLRARHTRRLGRRASDGLSYSMRDAAGRAIHVTRAGPQLCAAHAQAHH